ncbi:MAG: hypothetical protein K2H33_08070 [Muribaculaceae bacterium]|nr:hypothetical protein [Muribaculaceae bacterium]MDE6316714.1 hypothetical protein [Muribaculaceae bacterium]
MSIFSFFSTKKTPAKLPFHTDIHCHIVPGVDDGSPELEKSVELTARMAGWGIERIFLSPHVTQDTFENTPETLAEPFAALQQGVATAGIPVKLAMHAEYRIDEFFLQQIELGNLRPMPGNYLLVENSFAQEPWGLDKLLFDLKLKGYVPIMAHPERYLYYSVNNRDRYRQLHDTGLLFQINLLSLAGAYGKQEKQTAEWLLEHGMVEFIGSDIHRRGHADYIDSYLRSRDFTRHSKHFNNLLNDTI